MPVFESNVSPAGRFLAAYVNGPSPEAGIRNKNGRPGVAPVILGELMRGSALRLDAIGGAGSTGSVMTSGRTCAGDAITSHRGPLDEAANPTRKVARRITPHHLEQRHAIAAAIEQAAGAPADKVPFLRGLGTGDD